MASLMNRLACCATALTLALTAPLFAPAAEAQDGGLETQLPDQESGGSGGLQTEPGTQDETQGEQANIESTQHEDWVVQCRKQGDQSGPCRMGQGVRDSNADREIMQVIIANPPQGGPIANFVVPLGVNLRVPVAIKVDGTEIGQANYISCVQRGCVAQMQLTADQLAAMRRGRRLQVGLTGQQGRTRDVPASLLGFTAAYNDLTS